MTRMMTLHNQTFRCTLQYHKTSLQQIFNVKILIFMLLHDNKSTNILYVTILKKNKEHKKTYHIVYLLKLQNALRNISKMQRDFLLV